MASDFPPLPDEIWADPGRRDWYFRERKPDSVARYVRDTRIAALEADLAKEKAENARMREAAKAYHDAVSHYISDTDFDSDGNLASADAELFSVIQTGGKALR